MIKNELSTVVLTTDTTHHRYFVHQLRKRFVVSSVIIENTSVNPYLQINQNFTNLQTEFEISHWENTNLLPFSDYVETLSVTNVNNALSLDYIKHKKPAFIILFGTRKVSMKVVELAEIGCINLHGGNPQYYRGLDSHLWAIYHRDWNNLTVTLHYVDHELDSAPIILQSDLPIFKNMKLHQLRASTTEVCVKLTELALLSQYNLGWIPSSRQYLKGRYYSAMPNELRTICISRFDSYTKEYV